MPGGGILVTAVAIRPIALILLLLIIIQAIYTVRLIALSQGRCSDTLELVNLINVKNYPTAAFYCKPC